MGSVVLKSESLKKLLRPTPAKDVKQIGFSRLHISASQLKVLITKRHGLCLLPLVVEHIDCDLRQGDTVQAGIFSTQNVVMSPYSAPEV